MRTKWLKRLAWVIVLGGSLAAVAWFAWPRPIPVDLATATIGPMEVTIDEEARTRVRHIYTVSAPITGQVLRISSPEDTHDTSVHVGDQVVADETVVAVMQSMAPSFIDIRSREELQAARAASAAAVKLAEAEVRRIEAALEFSRGELERAQSLAATDTISVKSLDTAKLAVVTNETALQSAEALLNVRRSEYEIAAARLIGPSTDGALASVGCCVEIRAPASGRVLKVLQQSEGVVTAGTPLVEIGDPLDLEVVADLLSSDAVQIKVNAPVSIEGWGGPPLLGRVTAVEPEGFVKVSALGIEEQRVRAIVDFVGPPEAWSALGNEFRVIVRIGLWNADSALTVPVAALFRRGDDWAVFAVRDGRAKATVVTVGKRNERSAEILSGLSEGDQVVLHPSDRVTNGGAVAQRIID